ncbi:hypothetical protein OUZ56_031524 [Daphnia magna]|uniref:Uncharacterized protein n=1 Tax=Daphnia magna TaxID=35525 RepID=A0ABQ9ZUG4_9CRUS|nr:hypothetical protein OUZ56_031524 [Daphnia magna]
MCRHVQEKSASSDPTKSKTVCFRSAGVPDKNVNNPAMTTSKDDGNEERERDLSHAKMSSPDAQD